MRSLSRFALTGDVAPTRMLWLPGAYNAPQDFINAGFADAVRTRKLPLDLAYIDVELQYLNDRSVLETLRRGAVLPAREAGCAVWMGGISLGGFLALDYAATYPGELDGLCLLAPYLGNRMLTGEIAAARGVRAWQPGKLAEDDAERRVWRYIKNRRVDDAPLYLGFGREDRFAPSHRLMASALPVGSVDVVSGGHEWPTWSALWENFLDSHFA